MNDTPLTSESINISVSYDIMGVDYSRTVIAGLYIVEIYREINMSGDTKLLVEVTETGKLSSRHPKAKYDAVYDTIDVPSVDKPSTASDKLNKVILTVKLFTKCDGSKHDVMLNPIRVSFSAITTIKSV